MKNSKKKLLSFLCAFSLLFSGHAYSNEIINHAIGVFISPKGQSYFDAEIDQLLLRNGISLTGAYFSSYVYEAEEQALEDMLPDDNEMREVIINAKREIERFFMGLNLGKHRFNAEVKDVSIELNWDHMGVTFHKDGYKEKSKNQALLMNLHIMSSDIKLNIGSFVGRDLNHEFLGEIGIEGLNVSLSKDGEPFQMLVPVRIQKNNKGEAEFKVLPPQTNISELDFDLNFESPIKLPEIEIRINNHVVKLNLEEVENLVRENQDALLKKGLGFLQEWIEKDAPDMLSETVNNVIKEGVREVNMMDPVGAPEGSLDAKYLWGLEIADFSLIDDTIHIALDGYVTDPAVKTNPKLTAAQKAPRAPDLLGNKVLDYDLSLSINQGFVNKIIQLSYNRGYFKEFQAGDEKIKLTKQPVLNLVNKTKGKKPTLSMEIEYKVTGMQAMFVNNPIKIQFDVLADFPVDKDGKMKMVIAGVDHSSVNLDSKYIRAFTGTVRSAVADKFKEMEPGLKGFEIAEEFPVPSSLLGIPIVVKDAAVDPAGHLMVYLNYGD